MKVFIAIALAALLFNGCCSVTVCKDGGHDLVTIENTGWKFLGLMPIASGDPEYPNQEVSVWFCDSILLEVNMMMLDDAMRKYGYTDFKNLVSYKTQENSFLLFFKRYTYHTSAELLK